MASSVLANGGSSDQARSDAEFPELRNGAESSVRREATRPHAHEPGHGFNEALPVCERLRSLFGRVASEPVPDHLEHLARALEAALETRDGPVRGV